MAAADREAGDDDRGTLVEKEERGGEGALETHVSPPSDGRAVVGSPSQDDGAVGHQGFEPRSTG